MYLIVGIIVVIIVIMLIKEKIEPPAPPIDDIHEHCKKIQSLPDKKARQRYLKSLRKSNNHNLRLEKKAEQHITQSPDIIKRNSATVEAKKTKAPVTSTSPFQSAIVSSDSTFNTIHPNDSIKLDVHLTATEDGNVKIHWNKIDGVLNYEIWRINNQIKTRLGKADRNAVLYTDRTIVKTQVFQYQVIAVFLSGEKIASTIHSIMVECKEKSRPESKTVLRNDSNNDIAEKNNTQKLVIRLSITENNKVKIHWDSIEGIINYEIWRIDKNQVKKKLGGTDKNAIQYTDRTASKWDKYHYQVVAISQSGEKIVSEIQSINGDHKEQENQKPTKITIRDIDNMDGISFEKYCANILDKNGFKNVVVTRGSGDQGIDIISVKDGIKYGIQCKCYSTNIGNKAVQEVYSGKTFYKCHVGVVLTNRYFTPSAIELAKTNGVLLWDRKHLLDMINKAENNI